ncbi:hypothetical protein [Notoacmeibacter ruber]|uniref:Uncharacterized protein n=1 Tax=Notoacmeibacter ruber TaxID=2670375 RepID=A0A3L7J2K8_9HYPH|nr:hypothetical protein [Notoacmeibacter ruber]RLQ84848.1 hypothetical protein D8780_15665 [Notoacmeibacter ruber]
MVNLAGEWLLKTWCLGLAVLMWSTVVSFAEPMRFESVSDGGNLNSCCWIVAEGEITSETPATFEKFLQEEENPSQLIRMVGNGEDIESGLSLGRLIRQNGFHTEIGLSAVYFEPWYEEVEGGECIGACAYAFLGGEVRSIPEGSLFGVTPAIDMSLISDTDTRVLNTADLRRQQIEGQILTGRIVEYIRDMNVGANLYALAVSVQPGSGARMLTEDELNELDIQTAGDVAGPWTAIASGDGLTAYAAARNTGRELAIVCILGDYAISLAYPEGNLSGIIDLRDVVGPEFILKTDTTQVKVRNWSVNSTDYGPFILALTTKVGAVAIANAKSVHPVSLRSLPRAYSTPFQMLYSFPKITGDSRLPVRVLEVCRNE